MRYLKLVRSVPLLAAIAGAVALSGPAIAQEGNFGPSGTVSPRSVEARLAPYEVRRILLNAGYVDVSDLRYYRVGFPDNFYRAYAWHEGRQYQVRVSDENGQIESVVAVGRSRVPVIRYPEARTVDGYSVRRELYRQGYTQVDSVRFVDDGVSDYYVAEGWRDGGRYLIRIDARDNRVLSRTRVE
jgi:hypothetical protein